MKLWLKIEALINRILIWITDLFARLFLKIIPKSIPLAKQRFEKKLSDIIVCFKAWIIAKSIALFHYSKAKLIGLKSMKLLQVKEQLGKKSLAFKAKLETSAPKESIKQLLAVLMSPLVNLLNKINKMEPAKALMAISLATFIVLAIMQIVVSGSRIYDKTRAPAAVVEEEVIPPRPSYYKLETKQIIFNQVRFPVYSQGKNNIQFLSIDFELDLSNRNSVIYLQDNEFHLRDHLINNTEPIEPVFSLEKEGKGIIKDKVQKEINHFLHDNHVSGEVTAVNIIYLLGA